MNIYKILRRLLKLNNKDETLTHQLLDRFFPGVTSIGAAISKVEESFLYVSYELKSIQNNLEYILEDSEALQYDLQGVLKSVQRFEKNMKSK